MNKYIEKAKKIRSTTPYNCSQAVLLTFADEIELSAEQALKISSGFGSGMKRAGICGAISGAVMVLGMIGKDSQENLSMLYKFIADKHKGYVDCKDLLKLNFENGGAKKEHCDNMVYEAVEFVSEFFLLEENT